MEIEIWRERITKIPTSPRNFIFENGDWRKLGRNGPSEKRTREGLGLMRVCACVRQGKKTRGEQKSNCNTGKENMGDGSGEGRGGGSSEGGQAWFGFL